MKNTEKKFLLHTEFIYSGSTLIRIKKISLQTLKLCQKIVLTFFQKQNI